MNKLLIGLTLALAIAYVSGHARLMQPVSRGSAYRIYKDDFPYVEQDDATPCFQKMNTRYHGECGICGPIYYGDVTASERVTIPSHGYDHLHYSFEKGGPYYTGQIVENYKKGETIEVLIRMNAFHEGYYQFRVCNADHNEDPGEECFGDYLKDENGNSQFDPKGGARVQKLEWHDTDGAKVKIEPQWKEVLMYAYYIVLPADLTCDHCVFQWQWVGTPVFQDYTGCADISISA